jgi:hypothetical protein
MPAWLLRIAHDVHMYVDVDADVDVIVNACVDVHVSL